METLVESTTSDRFAGLRLGYRLELRQEGDVIEGSGWKVSENGALLSAESQTPISVRGTIANGRLRLTFEERGAERASGGTFDLAVADGDLLRGRFESDAAQSAGTVRASRR